MDALWQLVEIFGRELAFALLEIKLYYRGDHPQTVENRLQAVKFLLPDGYIIVKKVD